MRARLWIHQTLCVFVDENNDEDESEEPPKPEVKEVKEKDAFYSKK